MIDVMFFDLLAEKIAATKKGEKWRICGSRLSLSLSLHFHLLDFSAYLGPVHFKPLPPLSFVFSLIIFGCRTNLG
jgi:hypothetical protein